jgi:hypothetical protein
MRRGGHHSSRTGFNNLAKKDYELMHKDYGSVRRGSGDKKIVA